MLIAGGLSERVYTPVDDQAVAHSDLQVTHSAGQPDWQWQVAGGAMELSGLTGLPLVDTVAFAQEEVSLQTQTPTHSHVHIQNSFKVVSLISVS